MKLLRNLAYCRYELLLILRSLNITVYCSNKSNVFKKQLLQLITPVAAKKTHHFHWQNKKQLSGRIFDISNALQDRQTFSVHNDEDLLLTNFYHVLLKCLSFPSLMLHQHLQKTIP